MNPKFCCPAQCCSVFTLTASQQLVFSSGVCVMLQIQILVQSVSSAEHNLNNSRRNAFTNTSRDHDDSSTLQFNRDLNVFSLAVAHAQNTHHHSTEKPLIQCYKCGEPCKGEVLRVQNKHFHLKCFTCKGTVTQS